MAEPTPSESSWTDSFGFDAARRVLADLETDDLRDVKRVGDYAILRRLGGGGGGEVFLAVRDGSDRPCALKLLRCRLGDGRAAQRVWRELDILAQIRQPFIPQLLDHGRHQDRLFLVTEHIDGEPLREHCDRQRLGRAARVELLASVADAVQTLHEHGVIHRDIKPDNVLVTGQGQPVLIDLGIATLLASDVTETLTHEGEPVGSPAFMAPEQARGELAAVSTRSDVYGLGATALVLLTGEPPHEMSGALSDAIRRVAFDPPRDPHELDPSLPKPLAAVLRKAIEPQPEDRYASAGELAADLRRWACGEPVEASAPSGLQRLARLVTRHPIAATLAACLSIAILTIVATLTSVWWLNMQPYRLRVDRTQRASVELLSRAGQILHSWEAGGPEQIVFADIVERDAALGGGRAVLVAMNQTLDGRFVDRLTVFDIDAPETLLWSTGAGPPDLVMPAPITRNEGDRFRVEGVLVDDVFPELPGKEIVVVHRLYTWSACVVRVHDLGGRVLHEFWHDGGIIDTFWDGSTSQLVLCGFNSEGLWPSRGHADGVGLAPRPIVIFAVAPEHGAIRKEWIRTPGGRGTMDPRWYKCLFPPDQIGSLVGERAVLNLEGSRLGRTMLTVRPADDAHDVSFVLDASGRLVDRIVSDHYKATPGLPDPEVLDVVDLPPPVAPRP